MHTRAEWNRQMEKLRRYLTKRGHDFSRSPVRCGSCERMILELAQWKERCQLETTVLQAYRSTD